MWKLIPRIVCRCIDIIFFRPKGHSVRNKYVVLLNMASVYHMVAIRVNEASWAHVWRLRFCYLGMGYDTLQHSSKHFKCRSSNLPHHYLTSGRLLELRFVSYHLSFSGHSFRFVFMFFNRCRFSIHRRLINHSRMSSTAY
jgi:hypothetical protein